MTAGTVSAGEASAAAVFLHFHSPPAGVAPWSGTGSATAEEHTLVLEVNAARQIAAQLTKAVEEAESA